MDNWEEKFDKEFVREVAGFKYVMGSTFEDGLEIDAYHEPEEVNDFIKDLLKSQREEIVDRVGRVEFSPIQDSYEAQLAYMIDIKRAILETGEK